MTTYPEWLNHSLKVEELGLPVLHLLPQGSSVLLLFLQPGKCPGWFCYFTQSPSSFSFIATASYTFLLVNIFFYQFSNFPTFG